MSIDLISSTKKESAEVLTASALADDWYLNAYKVSALENKLKSRVFLSSFSSGGWNWRRIAVAGVLGVFAGLGIASLQMGQTASLKPQPVTTVQSTRSEMITASVSHPAVTPVASSAASIRAIPSRKAPVAQSSDDVARLTVRNRRLEALVKVLRQRPAEKRSVQEQTTYLGQ